MHYYQFNIGDYTSHTQHLDPLEDIAYRRMLDWIYINEKPLPNNIDQIAKYIRMRDECERITDVLQEYFELTETGYTQRRVEKEIAHYRDKSTKAKKAVEARWAKNRIKPHTDVLQSQSKRNTKQETLNTKQEPYKEKGKTKRFASPTLKEVVDRCQEMQYTNIDPDRFINFYEAKGWMIGKNKMKSWKAALANWSKGKNENTKHNGTKRYSTSEILGDINDTNW